MQANQTTKSRPASTPSLEIICTSYHHCPKNTRIGICSLAFPAIGLEVSGCAVHVTSERRMWIGFPCRLENGRWISIVSATTRSDHFRVQAVACKAVQQHLDSLQVHQPAPAQPSRSSKPAGPPKAEIPDVDIPI
jgi:hypothetical protein